jgi:hypothetical protein
MFIFLFLTCFSILFVFQEEKKGGLSMATKTEESTVTEERIAYILHEASALLRAQQVDVSG